MQAQKEAEALRSAVATQVRERAVAAQAQARLVAAKKRIKALEWSSEVITSRGVEHLRRACKHMHVHPSNGELMRRTCSVVSTCVASGS